MNKDIFNMDWYNKFWPLLFTLNLFDFQEFKR